jgi:hypothetical protein
MLTNDDCAGPSTRTTAPPDIKTFAFDEMAMSYVRATTGTLPPVSATRSGAHLTQTFKHTVQCMLQSLRVLESIRHCRALAVVTQLRRRRQLLARQRRVHSAQ